jgi:Indole-3-glycerol phosphate synthase
MEKDKLSIVNCQLSIEKTDILETIVANKRLEVERQKVAVPIDLLFNLGGRRMSREIVSMRQALEQSRSGIIAEFKRRSPSKGWLHPQAKVQDIVPAYENGGASACSILTDSDFFGGNFTDLQQARSLVKLPLLRKDFIIDEYQLYQARVLGADAILLIASCLTKEECRRLAETAHQLELEVLLEVHCEAELSYLNKDIDMLGVNNRNLGTFHTDIENSFRLIERMKSEAGDGSEAPLFVSESGISSVEVINKLREAGFRGFLMGETFMKTENPGEALARFKLTIDNF